MFGRFFHRESHGRRNRHTRLDDVLLRWSRDDVWTVRDAIQGTLILGATGSGKSTGSGAYLAETLLSNGFGGLVLTAKGAECATWEKYCERTGRAEDLVIFGPKGPWRLNFLDYEMNRGGGGAGITENIVALLSTVLEVADRTTNTSGGGREDEGYWRKATRQLMRNDIDLLRMAGAKISVPDLYRVVISAPRSRDEARSDQWKATSLCFQRLAEAYARDKTTRDQADLEIVFDYFMSEFPALGDKTRSVIISTFSSTIDILHRGLLGDLFCSETNITPEEIEAGKVIVVDLPAKEYAEVGIYAQVIWKYIFERAIERRTVVKDTRPVFLWIDEAQLFTTSYDAQFQSTCRSARVATVLLSQNLSSFFASLGGVEKGRTEATALFGNLTTKILHSNADSTTNEWAATLIGRSRQYFANGNSSSSDDQLMAMIGLDGFGQSKSASAGFSESYEFEIQPAEFSRLRTGGPANNWIVDGIVFQSGKVFRASGTTWIPVTFKQRH